MSITTQIIETRCLSSLSKVFADEDIKDSPVTKGSALMNESYSYQIAFRSKDSMLKGVNVRTESTLNDLVSVRYVGLVPSELPCYHDHDDQIIRSTPGLYPDPLIPIDDEGLTVLSNQWRSVWVSIDLNDTVTKGFHNIKVIFENYNNEILGEAVFQLEVIQEKLPDQELLCTQWFHTDCLASHYNVEVFSEAHWNLIDQFVKTLSDHGANMILTPLFTPPLDTEVGKERPTVQLIDVVKLGDSYSFNFDKLTRWIDLCRKRGVKYFEFSHLFTQWGARCAPKIEAIESGKKEIIFGWDTDATGNSYKSFLSQFLPKLVQFIKSHNLNKYVYFHVSDEPDLTHLESVQVGTKEFNKTVTNNANPLAAYQSAKDILHKHLSEFPFFDASSDYKFYEQGLIDNPIPSIDNIEPFLENKVPDLWIYYCRDQYKKVSNRFFNFPSSRNRIIGMQMYKFNIFGFLHWGYNFWYSELSRKQIDPFCNTDGDKGYPSGDAFLVYPGDHGPIESIRMEVFFEALQDLRVLQLLEQKIGRRQVIEILEEDLEQPLTFSEFPNDSGWLLNKRERINRIIASEYTQAEV